jgi:formamidopyrimidine-DNA glycosylase
MPELPEIYNLAKQLDTELHGKKIMDVEVRQEKCLNLPLADFQELVINHRIGHSRAKGKWIFTPMEPDAYFLLSLGMGGDVLYHENGEPLPDKYQLKFALDDGSYLTMGFWWFGYAHAVKADALQTHKMTFELGLSPLDDVEFTFEKFNGLLTGKRGNIKSFLTDQKNIAGIGNVYIQDVLFRSKLHPNRKIPDIDLGERKILFDAIKFELRTATGLGGLAYEKDLYNQPGRFKDFQVGYREGKPCPVCGTIIKKIKTGTTASFICEQCQK